MTNEQRDAKMREGKNLYIRGFSSQSISTVIDISINTINKWKKAENWEEAKKMHSISVGSLKAEILETFTSLKNGETPKISSDQLSKLSSAFEKLSDKKKNLAYMYDNFDELSELMAEEVTLAKGKEKALKLQQYKDVRALMQRLTNEKYKEALDD